MSAVSQFIRRDYTKTVVDDFQTRVEPKLSAVMWSSPVYDDDGKLTGWRIRPAFESHAA